MGARSMLYKLSLMFVIFVIAGVYVQGYAQLARMHRRVATINNEAQLWGVKNEKLHKEIEGLRSPEYIEKAARERLGLVMPGETLFVVAEPADPDAPPPVQKRPRREPFKIGD